jgi:exopolyphosphatase
MPRPHWHGHGAHNKIVFEMNEYLNHILPASKKLLKSNISELSKIEIVVGNESGDLDSAVCAATLAWHKNNKKSKKVVFPALNFSKKDLELKTEVVSIFQALNLSLESALFMEDLVALEGVEDKLEIVLVDHNVINRPELRFLDKVVTEVFDHHVKERKDTEKLKHFEVTPMGSCSTIIAEKVFQESSAEVIVSNTNIADYLNFKIILLHACLG